MTVSLLVSFLALLFLPRVSVFVRVLSGLRLGLEFCTLLRCLPALMYVCKILIFFQIEFKNK